MIADGKHPAKLFDITFGTTSAGASLVSFVWDLTDCNERVSYAFALTDSAGRPNRFAVIVTRRWVPEWDGTDLDWFRAHREELLGKAALVQTRDEKFEWITEVVKEEVEKVGGGGQWTGWSSSVGQHIKNENNHCPPLPSTSPKVHRIKLVIDMAKFAEMPEHIEPNFEEAKTLFDAVTEGSDKLDADLVWTRLAAKVGPMQIDFGEAEWQQMIDRIRQLKDWEGVVEV